MRTYRARYLNIVSGVTYVATISAATLEDARRTATDWPYVTAWIEFVEMV